jgi:hypothetical protein
MSRVPAEILRPQRGRQPGGGPPRLTRRCGFAGGCGARRSAPSRPQGRTLRDIAAGEASAPGRTGPRPGGCPDSRLGHGSAPADLLPAPAVPHFLRSCGAPSLSGPPPSAASCARTAGSARATSSASSSPATAAPVRRAASRRLVRCGAARALSQRGRRRAPDPRARLRHGDDGRADGPAPPHALRRHPQSRTWQAPWWWRWAASATT